MISSTLPASMQRVNGLLRAGDFRTAQAELGGIVRRHPDYPEARRLLAGATLALGDAAGAEQILREAIAVPPEWPPTLTLLGELLLNSGRLQEAEQFLKRAATGARADPRAALALARHYNDRQCPAQALDAVSPFCARGAVVPELAAQHVRALAALGRADEAVAFYRACLARAPASLPAEHALALALQASNRHAEAEAAARRALAALGRGDAALLYTQARSLIALGEFGRAEAALRECLRAEPRRADAHSDLARLVWMRSGDATQATAVLDRALQANANDDALWAAKAAILQGAGDARAAYACLAARTAHGPVPPALLVRAGLAALEFDPGTARELAERALGVVPLDAPARKLRVAALLGTGDARAALPACADLLRAEPDDQYLIALQTTAWRLLGDERYARLCDYRKWVVPYRLEAPPGWTGLGDFLIDLKRSLEALHARHRYPLLFQSLRHGTETTEDLARSSDPVIKALFAAFAAPIRDYIARIGRGADPLQRRNRGAWRFNGSWSVRLHTAGFHHNHVHPRGWISSSCYVQLPDAMANVDSREGVLTFGEPGILTAPALDAQYEVRPEAGMLALFPSYVWHGTVPFAGSGTRLTVAFDAVPAA